MNCVVFAGGAGTRLWPLSRRNSPKQFEALVEDESTLQMCTNRIKSFGFENIYISTNSQYINLVQKQVPDLAADHIFSEPARRDVAAAVGLSLMRLRKRGVHGTTAILWSDHFMKHPEEFLLKLKRADELIQEDPKRFVFLGERPRFANHNLGWIHAGKELKDGEHEFLEWKYRPELAECEMMFQSGEWLWNPGYFIFDIDFVLELYKKHQPTMYALLEDMVQDESKVETLYPTLEALSFDNAIVEKIDPSQAIVLKVDLGWSDPGTLYALKEALVPIRNENCVQGHAIAFNTEDSFIHNEEPGKLVATVGLEGVIVINTKDALLVVNKNATPDIKGLLKELEDKGLEQYL